MVPAVRTGFGFRHVFPVPDGGFAECRLHGKQRQPRGPPARFVAEKLPLGMKRGRKPPRHEGQAAGDTQAQSRVCKITAHHPDRKVSHLGPPRGGEHVALVIDRVVQRPPDGIGIRPHDSVDREPHPLLLIPVVVCRKGRCRGIAPAIQRWGRVGTGEGGDQVADFLLGRVQGMVPQQMLRTEGSPHPLDGEAPRVHGGWVRPHAGLRREVVFDHVFTEPSQAEDLPREDQLMRGRLIRESGSERPAERSDERVCPENEAIISQVKRVAALLARRQGFGTQPRHGRGDIRTLPRMQGVLMKPLPEQLAAAVEKRIVEPHLIARQQVPRVKVAPPEDVVASVREFLGNDLAADELIDRLEAAEVFRVAEMLNEALNEDQRGVFQAADPRHGNPVGSVKNPQIGDGIDRRDSGSHNKAVVDEDPVGGIPHFRRVVGRTDHRSGDGGSHDVETHLPFTAADILAAEDLGGAGEDGFVVRTRGGGGRRRSPPSRHGG